MRGPREEGSSLGLADETVARVVSSPSCPPDHDEGNKSEKYSEDGWPTFLRHAPSGPLHEDPAFRRYAERLIEKGSADEFVEKRLDESQQTVLPDGQVQFWERSTGRAVADTALALVPQIGVLVRPFYPARSEPTEKEKERFLEGTFETRAELAESFRIVAREKALKELEGDLEKIWRDDRYTLAQKKEIFFERWDECLERDVDEWAGSEVVLGAETIRTGILDFIRKRLPAGSPQAYTPTELAYFKKRQTSQKPFDPYAS